MLHVESPSWRVFSRADEGCPRYDARVCKTFIAQGVGFSRRAKECGSVSKVLR
jgi:hypothetical protein